MNGYVGVELAEELWHRIEVFARTTGGTPSEIVRLAFEEYEAHHNGVRVESAEDESFYDAAARLGLIGCLKGGPSDLSTNPKYFEGFGESD